MRLHILFGFCALVIGICLEFSILDFEFTFKYKFVDYFWTLCFSHLNLFGI